MFEKPNRSFNIQVSFSGLFAGILICSSLLTATGYFGWLGWGIDATSHFRVQYAVIQVICACFFLFKKKWKVFIAGSLLFTLNAAGIVPLYLQMPHQKIHDTGTFKILQFNLHTSSTQYAKTSRYIQQTKPDILSLQEINTQWVKSLHPALHVFPYSKVITREDNFGIGLFSRIPLQKAEVRYFGSAGVPSIVAEITVAGRPVSLIITHPVPPDGDGFPLRNAQLESTAAYRKKLGKSIIVIGDLNVTSWSYYFKRFTKAMNVYDSRKGFGVQASWPAMLPVLLIPIDHVLVSKNIVVLERKTGPDIGSDHYPVYVRLGVK